MHGTATQNINLVSAFLKVLAQYDLPCAIGNGHTVLINDPDGFFSAIFCTVHNSWHSTFSLRAGLEGSLQKQILTGLFYHSRVGKAIKGGRREIQRILYTGSRNHCDFKQSLLLHEAHHGICLVFKQGYNACTL